MQHSIAQSTKIDCFVNQLYFNILNVNPDPAIENYLEKNIPIYAKSNTKPIWEYAGSLHFDSSLIEYSIDTFTFTSHPYFKEKFKSGHFFFLIKKYQGKFNNVSDMYLSFDFDSKEDALNVYHKLNEELVSMGASAEEENDEEIKIAKFFDNTSKSLFQPVLVIFRQNLTAQKNCQVIFGVKYLMKNYIEQYLLLRYLPGI